MTSHEIAQTGSERHILSIQILHVHRQPDSTTQISLPRSLVTIIGNISVLSPSKYAEDRST